MDGETETKPVIAEGEDGAGAAPVKSLKRRNRPGTKNADMYNWEPLAVSQLEGPLAVEEYLQQLIRQDSTAIDTLITCPEGVSQSVWMYEHLRQYLKELALFIVHHHDVCNSETAPSMKITVGGEEYVFLCSAYNPPKECSAIDYMTNTVIQAVSMLNSNKQFPSRVTIKNTKHFGTLARRLYRIFAFSYFVHREQFDEFENKYHLCERFTKFCIMYKLIPTQHLYIPRSRWSS